MPDSLIYVSRLLTDRAMAHLRSLGVAVRGRRRESAEPCRTRGRDRRRRAAVVTLTERVDAELLAAAGPN